MSKEENNTCPDCGAGIPSAAPGGMCPRCLLAGIDPGSIRGSGANSPPPDDPDRTLPLDTIERRLLEANQHPGRESPASPHEPKKGARQFAPSLEELQELFPHLEIVELLGAGGMGAVYKARQPRLDRFVALKILSCPKEYHENFALRFEREAQLLAKLNHPNIVSIYDFGEIDRGSGKEDEDNLFYFMMEFVDGADLNKLIHTGGLEPGQALGLIPQICDALQFAHDEGITHRDVKPANILVDQKGNVRIADFGLAKLIESDDVEAMMTGLTMTGTSMGTPHYMAPEQWESPEKVDHRADIYSLGVVFYEMLTGERPHGVFAPPSSKTKVDNRIDSVVLRAMEREPDLRYQQASEVKEEVTRVVTSPVVVKSSSGQGRRLAGAATMALIAALIGGAIWWSSRPGGDQALSEPETEAKISAGIADISPDQPPVAMPAADFPVGKWTRVLTSQAEMEAVSTIEGALAFRDGWVDGSAPGSLASLNFSKFQATNGGVRLLLKIAERPSKTEETTIDQGVSINLRRVTRRGETDNGYRLNLTGLRDYRKPYMTMDRIEFTDGSRELLARIDLEKNPEPGDEFQLEFFAVGEWLIGRVNGQELPVVMNIPSVRGRVVLQCDHLMRDVEFINLDGLPEEEALVIAGVEPGTSQNITSLPLPPNLAAIRKRGGQLRSWNHVGSPSLNLSDAAGIDDFASFDGTLDPTELRWLARRNSGTSVTSLNDFDRQEELISITSHVGVLATGERLDCWGTRRKILPGDSIAAAYVSSSRYQFKLYLNRDGSLTLNPGGADPGAWKEDDLPETRALVNSFQDFIKIDDARSGAIALRSNGEVISLSGFRDLVTPNPPIKGAIDVACGAGFWAALTEEGKVQTWADPDDDWIRKEMAVPDGLGVAFAIRANDLVCAAQMADGSWRAWGGVKSQALIDQIESIGPAVDLLFHASHTDETQGNLLWIEPAIEPASAPSENNSTEGKVAGEERIFRLADDVALPFLWCPPGEFWMGSPESEGARKPDETRHRVTLTRGFWLGKYEFTKGDWTKLTGGKPTYHGNLGPDIPMTNVSWERIAGPGGFLESLEASAPDGWRFDLPTEAQWEYACRAGTETAYFWGNPVFGQPEFHRYGNVADVNSTRTYAMTQIDDGYGDEPAPVGSFLPNPWGFHDMMGNVIEMCLDWKADYPGSAAIDPTGPEFGQEKVQRGGSYLNASSDLRSATRGSSAPDFSGNPQVGFRLALVPSHETKNSYEKTELRPLVPQSPPGRLRGFTVSDSGEKTPLDLGELENLSDLIQIRTTVDGSNLQVFALRENGKVVAHNLPESWAHHTDRFNRAAVPIRHLGYNCLSLHHLVLIDRDGVPWPMLPGHPGQSNFPDPGEPVLDVRTTEEHSVMLTRSGRAVLWGGNYSRSADPWPVPPGSFLRNVAGICAFPEALFLLRPDGNVVAWGAGGEFPLPEVFRSSMMVSIAVNGIRLFGLDRDGQFWITKPIEGNEEPGLENDGEPVAENMSKLKDQSLTEPSVQDREGRWLAVEGQETVEFEEIRSQLAELDGIPGDAFVSGGHRLAESRFLLWIEPVEEGE